MIKYFSQMEAALVSNNPTVISVAVAQDEEVLLSVKYAMDQKIASCILVGDEAKIRPLMEKLKMPSNIQIVHEQDDALACQKAVMQIRDGHAQVLLKGLVNSSHYLRAVLNAEYGLRTGRLLSHLGAYEIPRDNKILFATDTGLHILPTVEEKKDIIRNAIGGLQLMGIAHPYIGILAANEIVNAKMPITTEAAEIAKFFTDDPDFKGTIEGPVSLDVAVSANAAKHKGITSNIAGKTDVFVFPSVESGNIWSKSMMHYANINMAGVILGASAPVILVSRADDATIKYNSIVFACYLANQARLVKHEEAGQ
ncbi:MAG: phosphate acyltransferase [Eubacteriales bacterium]|nr:phosphate acyltransferase [Eubacteriales bacterium]